MKLFKTILLILIFYYNTTTNASITNKILVSVGKEIITEYDVAEEIVFLKIFSEKKIERLKKRD